MVNKLHRIRFSGVFQEVDLMTTVKFDSQAGAYTDGTNYVKGSLIRKFARERMGKQQLRGRLSKSEVEAYWLDRFGVSANVA